MAVSCRRSPIDILSYTNSNRYCSGGTIFWSRSDSLKVVESFRLPKRFTQMVGRCHCFFAQCPLDTTDNEAERFAYIFSTLFHHSPFWCLAASWDPETNITYAFLHCTSNLEEECIPRLKRFLTKIARLALHPILLPLLIMDLETNLTLRDDEEWTEEIQKIENEIKQQPCNEAETSRTVNQLDSDLYSISQQLNECSIFLSLIERESEVVLIQLDQARGMISNLQSTSLRFGELSTILTKHVDFLINSRKSVFLRLKNLQMRSQTQLALTYKFLAHNSNLNIEVGRNWKAIALASSNDSTVMRNFAALSLALLLGTLIAVISPILLNNVVPGIFLGA